MTETREYWVNRVSSLELEISRLMALQGVQKRLIKSLQDENVLLRVSQPQHEFGYSKIPSYQVPVVTCS